MEKKFSSLYPNAKKLEIKKRISGTIWDDVPDIQNFYFIKNQEELNSFKNNIIAQKIPYIRNKGDVYYEDNKNDEILNGKLNIDFSKEILAIKMYYSIENVWQDKDKVIIESGNIGRDAEYNGAVINKIENVSFDEYEDPEGEFEICQRVINPCPKKK